MDEGVRVVSLRRSESCGLGHGLGFSILGGAGSELPHIIYDIIDNSPASESGELEAGDVILEVNCQDVHCCSTKEVLKCLRLSGDEVTLKLKRDPHIKAGVLKYLSSPDHNIDELHRLLMEGSGASRHLSAIGPGRGSSSDDGRRRNSSPLPVVAQAQPLPQQQKSNGSYTKLIDEDENNAYFRGTDKSATKRPSSPLPSRHSNSAPRSERYMMTGEVILNLSRTQQSSGLIPKQKTVDSLRYHNSVPTSPNESDLGLKSIKVCEAKQDSLQTICNQVDEMKTTSAFSYASGFVRTSRSEDHLQFQKDSISTVDIDIDEDVTSSLNTLLDTRPDAESTSSLATTVVQRTPTTKDNDRIVWTYNAPVCSDTANGSASRGEGVCSSDSENLSPQNSVSPNSPTSVSSSVMSSESSKKMMLLMSMDGELNNDGSSESPAHLHNGDYSQSEAVSNISSPDFQEEESLDILSSKDLMMELSDPSDSDSTILVSEKTAKRRCHGSGSSSGGGAGQQRRPVPLPFTSSEHRIVLQVKGQDGNTFLQAGSDAGDLPTERRRLNLLQTPSSAAGHRGTAAHSPDASSGGNVTPDLVGYQELRDSEDDIPEDDAYMLASCKSFSPPPPPPSLLQTEDDSDIESLHSFHYSPKAVDIPSAVRLAKRLHSLDGFKKSDVSRHLSKNNDFSRAVAEEYLRFFKFEGDSLDTALRKFLRQFSLSGETQERERVLVHFSKRFLDCNPGSFNSQDAVHTLTCAIMLLNTDLHAQNIGRKMTCNEFIENLSELNDGENFPREVLKMLYQAIKNNPLEWALDEESEEAAAVAAQTLQNKSAETSLPNLGHNPFLDVPNSATAIEYKKGYVMRKSCVDSNGKKTPFGKRGWKMFYCTLRDMVLYLHKDEHGFRKSQMYDNLHNAIRVHHALATKAADYSKKQHVFRLQTADQSEFLFQTSDPKELQSWIDTINFVAASFSAQPLASAVGSQRKFQRPLLPCSHTKLNLREQLRDHEEGVARLEAELEDHRKHTPDRQAKSLTVQNYKEKDVFLKYELKRYKTYASLLRSKMSQYPELEPSSLVETSIGELDERPETSDGGSIVPPPIPERPSVRASPTNRHRPKKEKKKK